MTTPEMIGHLKSTKTIDKVMKRLENIFDFIHEDVYFMVRSRGWYFQDFDENDFRELCEKK